MSAPPAFKEARRGFTLIEVLIVTALMGILLALTVPSVTGMLNANRLNNGGNMVAGMVTSARQLAMSKNTLTALVLLADQGTDEDGRALTILEYDPAKGWMQHQSWETLPTGIIVDIEDQAASTFMTNSPSPFPFLGSGQENPPVTHRGDQVGASKSYAARLFLPGGGLANGHAPARIRLVEGHIQEGKVIYTSKKSPRNFYDVTIIGDTGLIRTDRP